MGPPTPARQGEVHPSANDGETQTPGMASTEERDSVTCGRLCKIDPARSFVEGGSFPSVLASLLSHEPRAPMCCFTTKTEVHGTSIFARFTSPESQALVYTMAYAAKEPTAMILPLPVALPAKEDAVRFTSLKDYPSFFDDLGRGFPAIATNHASRSKSAAPSRAAAPLEVHDVGDFVASFVPKVDDFARLDPRFVIRKDVWAKIPIYADYGFAVFQLKELSGSPHPIAFTFDTRDRERLFFPTVHIHDGSVHEAEDFDHVLYLQEPRLDAEAGSYDGPDAIAKTGFVRSKEKAGAFTDVSRAHGLVDEGALVHKASLRGRLPNRDTFFTRGGGNAAPLGSGGVPTSGPSGSGCGRCDASGGGIEGSLPAVATALGLGWIIRRRNDVRGR